MTIIPISHMFNVKSKPEAAGGETAAVAEGKRTVVTDRQKQLVRKVVLAAVSLLGLLVVWHVASVAVDRTVFPTPAETWTAIVKLFTVGDSMTGYSAWDYIGSSLGTFLKGFAVALVIAYPLGLVLGRSAILRDLLCPALDVIRPIAPVAWAPVFVILMGYQLGPLCVVLIGAFFPLLTSVMFGVMKIDRNWIDAIKTLGANESQVFTKVVVPSSIPYLMNGVKTGLGIGWMCIVSAELYASPVGGLGFFISNYAQSGNWPNVFAGIVIIGLLGLITMIVAEALNRAINKRMGVSNE